uniref:Uncharacterized protein n=1 Tax=Helianthus annuus TaxID=4232 RepID=A0A251VB07_HELAN
MSAPIMLIVPLCSVELKIKYTKTKHYTRSSYHRSKTLVPEPQGEIGGGCL